MEHEMNDAIENGNGATRKKGQKVQTFMLDAQGEVLKGRSIPEDVSGIRVEISEAGTAENIIFADLPRHILIQAAAFGLKTVYQNCVNTASDALEGAEVFERRMAAHKNGEWSTSGDGATGTPMVIEAIQASLKTAGYPDEKVTEKVSELQERWESLDQKGRKEQQKAWLSKAAVQTHFNALRAEEMRKRLAKLEATQAGGDAEGDATDLGDL